VTRRSIHEHPAGRLSYIINGIDDSPFFPIQNYIWPGRYIVYWIAK